MWIGSYIPGSGGGGSGGGEIPDLSQFVNDCTALKNATSTLKDDTILLKNQTEQFKDLAKQYAELALKYKNDTLDLINNFDPGTGTGGGTTLPQNILNFLAKVGIDAGSGNPTWNGSIWPGSGGSGGTIPSDVVTKAQLDAAILKFVTDVEVKATVNTMLGNYYTKAQIDSTFATKVSVNQMNVYIQSEVRRLETLISSMSGGGSGGSSLPIETLINDSSTTINRTWSSTKIQKVVNDAITNRVLTAIAPTLVTREYSFSTGSQWQLITTIQMIMNELDKVITNTKLLISNTSTTNSLMFKVTDASIIIATTIIDPEDIQIYDLGLNSTSLEFSVSGEGIIKLTFATY